MASFPSSVAVSTASWQTRPSLLSAVLVVSCGTDPSVTVDP